MDEASNKLILGLGNPGERYRETRHNVGFLVVDELARRLGLEWGDPECNSDVARRRDLVLAKPLTYMNRSGFAARCFAERAELAPQSVLVVVDDVDLPLGSLRLRAKGGPGGHRGLESITENLRTDRFPRLRLGVAREEGRPAGGNELVEYVLAPFEAEEAESVQSMVERAAEACQCWVEEGPAAAMNRFNGT